MYNCVMLIANQIGSLILVELCIMIAFCVNLFLVSISCFPEFLPFPAEITSTCLMEFLTHFFFVHYFAFPMLPYSFSFMVIHNNH